MNITEEGRGGGALYRIIDVANYLKGKVVFVIVCPVASTDFIDKLKTNEIAAVPVSINPLSRHWLYLFQYFLFFIPDICRIYKVIRAELPDLVYCNGSWQVKGIIAAYWAGVRSIWHMNDSSQPRLVRMLFKLVSPLCQHYLYASAATKAYYLKVQPELKGKKSGIIPAPVDTDRFSPSGPKSDLMNAFAGPKILTTGYINPNKNLELLIRIAYQCLAKPALSRAHFFVLGPVLDTQIGYKKKLDDMIANFQLTNVHFLGYQENVDAFLRSSDLYLCTSAHESSPISIWEALACAVPVVSTSVGDVNVVFDKYSCGAIAPSNSAMEFAAILDRLIAHPNIAQYKANARKAALELFDLEKVGPQHLSFYTSIIQE